MVPGTPVRPRHPHRPSSPFLTEANAKLKALDKHLGLEVSTEDQQPTLIVTTGATAASIPDARAIAAAAPAIPNWKVIALKPEFGFAFTINHHGTRFEPQAMWFMTPEEQPFPGKLVIRVGIPNYTSTSPAHARDAVRIVLEKAIGEQSLAEDIASFDVLQLPRAPEPAGYIGLFELPDVIAERRGE
ncbi:MAG: hypothetical protein QM755_16780 [Luteolibacter sp.]